MHSIKIPVLLGTLLLYGCNSSQPTSPASASSQPKTTQVELVLDMKQLMSWVIDPHAVMVWASVGSIATAEGTKEIAPHTDEEWNAIRNNLAIVVEAGNLLMMEGRSRGDDWNEKARGLIETSKAALKATEAKDPEELFTAGGDMYLACSACHATYLIGAQTSAPAK